MPDVTISRPGQNQLAGDELALFLRKFSGEVLTTFEQLVATAGAYRSRKISGGKSYQFPAISRAGAKRFTVGDNLLVTAGYQNQIEHTDRTIYIDNPVIADVVIADFDEAVSHYEFRQEYSRKLAEALAIPHDQHALSTMVAAARSALTFAHADYVSDRVLNKGATGYDSADKITAALFEAQTIFRKNDAPDMGNTCFLRPDEYGLLLWAYGSATPSALANADYGTLGDLSSGQIMKPIAGFTIKSTKNLPSTDLSAVSTDLGGTGSNDVFGASGIGYNGDFSTTVGVCVNDQAIGSVNVWDLGIQSEYKIELQGNLTVARHSEGFGVLRPEVAVELSSAAV